MQHFQIQLISIREAYTQLGIGRTKFYALRRSGELKGTCRIGGRTLISQAAIDEFVAHRLDASGRPSPSLNPCEGER